MFTHFKFITFSLYKVKLENKLQYLQIHITRNLEHHIERHYEIESNKTDWLQQIEIGEEFYEDRLALCLNVKYNLEFNEVLLDHYGEHEAFEDFFYIKEKNFTDFFRNNAIDVPRCFSKTKNIRRPINQLDLLKLNNYLMRDGKRLKTFNFLSQSIWSTQNLMARENIWTYKTSLGWQTLYFTFNYITYSSRKYYTFPSPSDNQTTYGHTMLPVGKYIENEWNSDEMVFKNLYKMLPIFSFYIYKVDKKIYKNTRGRSGKFTFIWKYVAPFKRQLLVMHWIMKELRIKPGRSLQNRLDEVLRTLCINPKQTWIWKARKFSHAYVYKNAKRTLASTYRTVTK